MKDKKKSKVFNELLEWLMSFLLVVLMVGVGFVSYRFENGVWLNTDKTLYLVVVIFLATPLLRLFMLFCEKGNNV